MTVRPGSVSRRDGKFRFPTISHKKNTEKRKIFNLSHTFTDGESGGDGDQKDHRYKPSKERYFPFLVGTGVAYNERSE